MDAKTEALLLKLRKSATASFGLKEWTAVLTELGFKVEVTGKEGRTVTQVTVLSSLGQALIINKEPNYKAIHFYGLPRWLKNDIKVDMVELASIRLGLETPEQEAKLNALYVRDLTNTGTCPVCGGNYKRTATGGLVHHGFQRPGDGSIHGDCFAVGFQPWELSPEGAARFVVEVLKPRLESTERYLAQLKAGEITEFILFDRVRVSVGKYEKKARSITREANHAEWSRELDREIASSVSRIDKFRRTIEMFETAIAAWKQDILPEFKYAGKFRGA